MELAVRLTERLEQKAEPATDNGNQPEAVDVAATAQAGEETISSEEAEEGETPDVFSLNRVPPKRSYTMRVKYEFVGRGKPRPYPLENEE